MKKGKIMFITVLFSECSSSHSPSVTFHSWFWNKYYSALKGRNEGKEQIMNNRNPNRYSKRVCFTPEESAHVC